MQTLQSSPGFSPSQWCGSGIYIPDPNFSNPDLGQKVPGSGSESKNLSIFNPKNCFWALGNMIQILIFYPSRIQGSKRHWIPDPNPQHWSQHSPTRLESEGRQTKHCWFKHQNRPGLLEPRWVGMFKGLPVSNAVLSHRFATIAVQMRIKGAQVWDFWSLEFPWFLHHKAVLGKWLWGLNINLLL